MPTLKTMEKIENGREYRVFAEDLAAGESEEMRVKGYATVFNQPYTLYDDGEYRISEIIDSRAFDEADMSDVIMQYNHEGRVYARNKNGTLFLTPDEHGLRIDADLGGTEIGKQLYQEIKGGYTDKMSFGFTVAEDQWTSKTTENGTEETRTITKIKKLYDVSAVSIPANDATSISARKIGEGVIANLKAERLRAGKEKRQKDILKLKIRIRKELSNENT